MAKITEMGLSKYELIIGRLPELEFFRHINTNTYFQNIQFKAISVTLNFYGVSSFAKNDRTSVKAKMGYGWAASVAIRNTHY